MAPYALLALVLAAANLDLPIGRNTPPPAPVAPAGVAAPQVAATPAAPITAPTDDYGYVAFCYGAESAYLGLYDQVMPEVTRIERTFPGSIPVEEALAEYPQLRSDSQAELADFAAALTAAERASIQPIAQRGFAMIQQGRSTWAGAATATPAQTAQAWMGWSPADDCEPRAKDLADRSRPLGGLAQTLSSQGSTDLDRAAHPALASTPVVRATPPASLPAATLPAVPGDLALRGAAPAPAVTAPPTTAAAGLSVSFGASAVATPTANAPAATPTAAPPLISAPQTASGAEPLPWRGVL